MMWDNREGPVLRSGMWLLLGALALLGALPALAQAPPPEVSIVPIALSGPAAARQAEISGLAWHGETLLLVLENPNDFAEDSHAGTFFALEKVAIVDYLAAHDPAPLVPRPVPILAPDLRRALRGFDGFEAAVFVGDEIYLTVEMRPVLGETYALLLRGTTTPDLSAITLDLSTVLRLDSPAPRPNISHEALTVVAGQLLAFYEANGTSLNSAPRAQVIDRATFTLLAPVPIPALPYRLTDATLPDDDGVFWVSNTFFPGDRDLAGDADVLAERYGRGATHAQYPQVERLVALRTDESGAVTWADVPPVWLALPDAEARNWEGLARLDGRGFLLVTDKHPQTILAFVPLGE